MVTGTTNANKRITVSYIIKIVGLLHASPTNVAIHRKVRLVCYSETLNYLLPLRDVPLQFQKGPEGSRKLRFPDFVTTA